MIYDDDRSWYQEQDQGGENVIRPEVESWQQEEERGHLGVPLWAFVIVVLLMLGGVVLNIRTKIALDRALQTAEGWSSRYYEAETELSQLMTEDGELFKLLINEIDAHKEAFRVLKREREYYKDLVPEDQRFSADKEITDLLNLILPEN